MNDLTAMTVYQPYFNQRKALYLGVTGAGAGAGTLLLPFVLRALFDNYSFSGAMLLYGKSSRLADGSGWLVTL